MIVEEEITESQQLKAKQDPGLDPWKKKDINGEVVKLKNGLLPSIDNCTMVTRM